MANLANGSVGKASDVANDFLGKMGTSSNQLEKIAHNAGEKAGELTADFASTARKSIASSREYVQANPIRGVAIAAATGVVVGSLLTMIMRRSRD